MEQNNNISAQQLFEIEHAAKVMAGMLPSLIPYFGAQAQVLMEKKKALIEAGFTEDEALQIVIARKTTEL